MTVDEGTLKGFKNLLFRAKIHCPMRIKIISSKKVLGYRKTPCGGFYKETSWQPAVNANDGKCKRRCAVTPCLRLQASQRLLAARVFK